MPDSRILRGSPVTLSAVFDDGGEAAVDPGVTTITITRSDGTVLVAAAATAGTDTAPRTYALAAQTDLDILTAVWTGAARTLTTTHEVVGGFIVPLSAVRSQKDMESDTKYPTEKLEEARAWFEDLAENFCDLSFTTRFKVETLNGNARGDLSLTRRSLQRIRWATIGGVAAATTAWVAGDESVYSPAGFPDGRANVTIAYEHGLTQVPADVRRASLTAIRYRLVTDQTPNLPDRALVVTSEFGTVQLSQPGMHSATGIREVDAVLARYRIPAVG